MVSLQVFFWTISGLMTAIGGLIVYIYSQKTSELDSLKAKISLIELEVAKIKGNYLDRFERVNSNIFQTKEQIVDMLHDMSIKITELTTKVNDRD